ncbi:ubiquitin-like protein FUBI isoform X3 [Cherax quadricarinatus]
MQIFVRSGATHVLDVDDQQTVGHVRSFISQAEGLPEAEVRLYAAGNPLDNDEIPLVTLQTDAIDVNVALKGGEFSVPNTGAPRLTMGLRSGEPIISHE